MSKHMVTFKPRWGILAFVLIAAFAFLVLMNRQRFPQFLDIYYHLNIMRGFDRAGGIVTRAFWELAPEGTVNLYPPLFHILLLALYKAGAGILFAARLLSILPFFTFLAVLCFVIGRLFSKQLGFFVVAAACLPYTFFLKSTITVPSALVLIFLLLTFYAIERKKTVSATLLLSLSFYTHLALPWLGVLTLLIYGLLRKEAAKTILFIIVLAIFLAAPFLCHLFTNLDKLENILGIQVGENELLEVYPLLCVFAAIGLFRLREKTAEKHCFFFIAMFIGLLPMALNYRYRFLSAEGLLPVIFFAGMGLDKAYSTIGGFFERKAVNPKTAAFYFLFIFVIINIICPTLSIDAPLKSRLQERKLKMHLMDSTAVNLITPLKRHLRPMEFCLYNSEAADWVKTINKNTAADDIICSNYTYIGSMLSAISGRANAARLFYEIKEPQRPINEFGSSKLAVWFREMNGEYDMKGLDIAYNKYKYCKIAETEKAVILIRDSALKSVPSKPVVTSIQAFLILAFLTCFLIWDMLKSTA